MLNLVEKFTPAVEADTNDAGLTTVEYAVAAAVVTAGAGARLRRPRRHGAAGSRPSSTRRLTRSVGGGLRPSPRFAAMNSHTHSRNDSGLATVEFAIVGSLLSYSCSPSSPWASLINAHMQAAPTKRSCRCARSRTAPSDIAPTPTIADGVIVDETVTKTYRVVRSFHSLSRATAHRDSELPMRRMKRDDEGRCPRLRDHRHDCASAMAAFALDVGQLVAHKGGRGTVLTPRRSPSALDCANGSHRHHSPAT